MAAIFWQDVNSDTFPLCQHSRHDEWRSPHKCTIIKIETRTHTHIETIWCPVSAHIANWHTNEHTTDAASFSVSAENRTLHPSADVIPSNPKLYCHGKDLPTWTCQSSCSDFMLLLFRRLTPPSGAVIWICVHSHIGVYRCLSVCSFPLHALIKATPCVTAEWIKAKRKSFMFTRPKKSRATFRSFRMRNDFGFQI